MVPAPCLLRGVAVVAARDAVVRVPRRTEREARLRGRTRLLDAGTVAVGPHQGPATPSSTVPLTKES